MEDNYISKEHVIKLLVRWQQTLTPKEFPSTKDLDETDFFDAPLDEAIAIGLKDEFETALKEAKKH